MKKTVFLALLAAAVLTLSNCGSSKKAASAPASTYQDNLHTLILNNCSPCHVPEKGGKKKPYDNYENAKTDIDEILRRIQLNPGEKGYMPFKREKLNDSTIAAFRQWKADGLLEK